MDENILRVENLGKTFPNGTQALRNINVEVKKGEFLAVIGLSGSGKSTLLRCLNRLQEPTVGKIYFQDVDIATATSSLELRQLRRQMAMIFQQFNLIPRQSVLKNVLMGALGNKNSWQSFWGIFSPEERVAALDKLRLVGIADKAGYRADHLSGGQQQRVAIARALMQKPSILLADEPVSALDPVNCYAVMDYLKKVNTEMGITVIANLHFISLVRKYATRVLALKDGELIFSGPPEQITEEWFQKIYGEEAQDVATNSL